MRILRSFILLGAVCATAVLGTQTGWAQTSPYRGLWVGTAGLEAVNQVTTSRDEANVAVAEDPLVPTLSYDRADLRIILHVNGAGQVSLLKDVAIVNRNPDTGNGSAPLIGSESDLSLVTDPDLYVNYPPQPALRIASAVFDFGDSKPTEILDEVVELAANEASAFVLALDPLGHPLTAQSLTVAAITSNLLAAVTHANIPERFDEFLDLFDDAALLEISTNTSAAVVTTLTTEAEALRDNSSYGDTRGLEMIQAVIDAVGAADPTNSLTAAINTASSYADIDNLYQRFVSGNSFGDMITAGAEEAGIAAKLGGATEASIEAAMRATTEGNAALIEAIQVRVQRYSTDTRTDLAVGAVLSGMAATAFLNAALPSSDIQDLTEDAGRAVLASMVARYPVPQGVPTFDYTEFVDSSDFADIPAAAAAAAAQGAVEERDENLLFSANSVYGAAKLAVINALENNYLVAARANRTELPLVGRFGPGEGDPTPVRDLTVPTSLGSAGLEGRIFLPQRHPTNPFRHRRHPDHTAGFNIERIVRFDFDGSTNDSVQAAGFGVDRITGMYREEIFGLHKPLGQDPLQPIGLKTEGPFDLQRISFIDTLNTR